MADDESLRAIQRALKEASAKIARLSGDRPVPLFGEFATEYMAQKLASTELRQTTKSAFEQQVRLHLSPAFGRLALDKIGNVEWRAWVDQTREDKTRAKPMTRFFNAKKCLVEILCAAREAGHIEKVPKFDNPDEKRDVGRVLEDKEVIAILWRARRPFRFIFYTFWRMGCRPREILKWEWDMVRWNEPADSWIDIPARISKNNRSRSIAVSAGVSRRLEMRFRRRQSIFCFPATVDPRRPQLSYHAAFATACRRAKVRGAMVYDFRRTFITKAAIRGDKLLYVAKHLDTSMKMIESVYAKSDAATMRGLVK